MTEELKEQREKLEKEIKACTIREEDAKGWAKSYSKKLLECVEGLISCRIKEERAFLEGAKLYSKLYSLPYRPDDYEPLYNHAPKDDDE